MMLSLAKPSFAVKRSTSGDRARAGVADTRREEGLADFISMHSLVAAQGNRNTWQPLIAYAFQCKHVGVMHRGKCMLCDGDWLLCALCADSVAKLFKEHCYRLWEASGKATGIDSSPTLLEKIGLKDRGITLLSVVCMIYRSLYRWQWQFKVESDSNSFVNSLYKNWRQSCSVLVRPG